MKIAQRIPQICLICGICQSWAFVSEKKRKPVNSDRLTLSCKSSFTSPFIHHTFEYAHDWIYVFSSLLKIVVLAFLLRKYNDNLSKKWTWKVKQLNYKFSFHFIAFLSNDFDYYLTWQKTEQSEQKSKSERALYLLFFI